MARPRRPRKMTKTLPDTYKGGFLATIQRGSSLGRRLNANFAALVEDCGGVDSLNRARLMLIERLTFLNEVASQVEQSIVLDPKKQVNLLGKYTTTINAMVGVIRTLRLNEPEPDPLEDLYDAEPAPKKPNRESDT